jgi:hypothetical protein
VLIIHDEEFAMFIHAFDNFDTRRAASGAARGARRRSTHGGLILAGGPPCCFLDMSKSRRSLRLRLRSAGIKHFGK